MEQSAIQPSSNSQSENERVIYESQRNHELELNKATAAFEHAIVSPLFLLNGGGAVAFLTLLGSTSKNDSAFHLDLRFAILAVFLWALALGAAAHGVHNGYACQRDFSRATSLKRRMFETALDVGYAMRAAIDKEFKPGAPTADHAKVRTASFNSIDRLMRNARGHQRRWERCIRISQLGFVAGVAAAAASVLLESYEGGPQYGPRYKKAWAAVLCGLLAFIAALSYLFWPIKEDAEP